MSTKKPKAPESPAKATDSESALLDEIQTIERLLPELFCQNTELEKNIRDEIGRELKSFRNLIQQFE